MADSVVGGGMMEMSNIFLAISIFASVVALVCVVLAMLRGR